MEKKVMELLNQICIAYTFAAELLSSINWVTTASMVVTFLILRGYSKQREYIEWLENR